MTQQFVVPFNRCYDCCPPIVRTLFCVRKVCAKDAISLEVLPADKTLLDIDGDDELNLWNDLLIADHLQHGIVPVHAIMLPVAAIRLMLRWRLIKALYFAAV